MGEVEGWAELETVAKDGVTSGVAESATAAVMTGVLGVTTGLLGSVDMRHRGVTHLLYFYTEASTHSQQGHSVHQTTSFTSMYSITIPIHHL